MLDTSYVRLAAVLAIAAVVGVLGAAQDYDRVHTSGSQQPLVRRRRNIPMELNQPDVMLNPKKVCCCVVGTDGQTGQLCECTNELHNQLLVNRALRICVAMLSGGDRRAVFVCVCVCA